MSEKNVMENIRVVFEERLQAIREVAEQKYNELVYTIAQLLPYEAGTSVSSQQGWNKVNYTRKFKQPIPVGVMKPFSVSVSTPKVEVIPRKVEMPKAVEIPQVGEIKGITDIPKPEKININLKTLTKINIPDINVPRIPNPPNYADRAYWEGVGITTAVGAMIGYNPYAWWDPLRGAKAVAVTASLAIAIKIGETLKSLWETYIKRPLETINNDIIGNASNPKAYSLNWVLDTLSSRLEQEINSLIGNPDSPSLGTLNHLIKYGIGVPADNPPKGSVNYVLSKLHNDIAVPLYNFGKDVKSSIQNTINDLVEKINMVTQETNKNVENTINEVSKELAEKTQFAINTGIQKVYELMGMFIGMGMTPVMIKQESGGFSWWAPQKGVTLMYIVAEAEV